MPIRLDEHDDDGMSEILSRALRKEAEMGGSKIESLVAAASELGISPEALKEAEQEYRVEAQRKEELLAYQVEARKGLSIHFGVYIIINAFLTAINVMTFRAGTHEWWFPFCLLGWGIGVAIHAMVALRKPGWNDPEFQRWRQSRAFDEPGSSG